MSEVQMKILSMVKCLRGFGPLDLNQLLSVASKVFWEKGSDIFMEGDSGKDMYIICSGKTLIWKNSTRGRISLAILSEGESFGEMGLVYAGKRSAGAQAAEDTLALKINHAGLHNVPNAASILYRNIARALAERLTIANDIIIFQTQNDLETPPPDITGRHRTFR